jgi:hypothetical protein
MSDSLTTPEYTIKRLRELQPMQSMVYFTGFLEEERLSNPNGPANTIANVAYGLMERGLIHLTQKRISPPITQNGLVSWSKGTGKGFHYIAIGATRKKQAMRWS